VPAAGGTPPGCSPMSETSGRGGCVELDAVDATSNASVACLSIGRNADHGPAKRRGPSIANCASEGRIAGTG
jgi:hypothetical protein